MPTDLGTGFWTQRIDPKARVMIDPDGVQVRYHRYDGLPMAEVVAALLDRLPAQRSAAARDSMARGRTRPVGRVAGRRSPPVPSPGIVRVAEVIAALQDLDQSRYSFVTDVGDSWFIGLELRADVFVAAGYYSSMGFAVPAALGAGIADPSRRPLVIVGDGAFQMTGIELATHVDQGLRPIVLLLNNGGYGMLEAIDRPAALLRAPELGLSRPGPSLGAEAERVASAGRAQRGAAAGRGRAGRLPDRGVHRQGRPLAGHGPDPHSCPFGLPDQRRNLNEKASSHPVPRASKAFARGPQLSRGLSGTCLIGTTDWIWRRPTSVMACFQADRVVVAEDVIRGGGQDQPGAFRQLILELARAPSGMANVEDGLAVVGGGQQFHGVQLGGDEEVVGDDEVGQRPLVVDDHRAYRRPVRHAGHFPRAGRATR